MKSKARMARSALLTAALWLTSISLSSCLTMSQPGLPATASRVPSVGVTQFATVPPLPNPSAAPAFPEAEGFGSQAKGGRGGQVIEVTNLDDAGSGSLRAAIEANGPRIVVFRVAGTIGLNSTLVIANPFITIAGQTAPGGGVTLRAMSANVDALILIQTHYVIVRYLTFRAGPAAVADDMEIFASSNHDTYNVVVDHNSMSWAVNRDLATWYDVHDVTIQWNIFSEGLNCSIHPKGCHSKGVLIGGYASDENKNQPGAKNISFHHNLMAHNAERAPYIEAAGVIDVVNNVAYDPSGTFSHIDMVDQLAPDLVNYVGNFYKPGPNTEVKYGIRALDPGSQGAQIFAQGNIGPHRENDSLPDINIVDPDSRQFVVSTPFPAAAITTTTAAQAYDRVLGDAGASQGLNCDGTSFVRRDAIDTRIVNDVKNGTGKIIDNPSQVGGWLSIAPAAPCDDSDHDGMPDTWEQRYGLNPSDPSDGPQDANGNGYTNVEEFLNGTKPVP